MKDLYTEVASKIFDKPTFQVTPTERDTIKKRMFIHAYSTPHSSFMAIVNKIITNGKPTITHKK